MDKNGILLSQIPQYKNSVFSNIPKLKILAKPTEKYVNVQDIEKDR